jgi:hypothetical protein
VTASRRRVVDARLHLLSRQVVDLEGEPVTTVDDLELVGEDGDEVVPGAPARLAALLTGPVLVTRVLGGTPPSSRWERIDWSDVESWGVDLRLRVRSDALDLDWPERWLRTRLIGRIPGGRHDPGSDR